MNSYSLSLQQSQPATPSPDVAYIPPPAANTVRACLICLILSRPCFRLFLLRACTFLFYTETSSSAFAGGRFVLVCVGFASGGTTHGRSVRTHTTFAAFICVLC